VAHANCSRTRAQAACPQIQICVRPAAPHQRSARLPAPGCRAAAPSASPCQSTPRAAAACMRDLRRARRPMHAPDPAAADPGVPPAGPTAAGGQRRPPSACAHAAGGRVAGVVTNGWQVRLMVVDSRQSKPSRWDKHTQGGWQALQMPSWHRRARSRVLPRPLGMRMNLGTSRPASCMWPASSGAALTAAAGPAGPRPPSGSAAPEAPASSPAARRTPQARRCGPAGRRRQPRRGAPPPAAWTCPKIREGGSERWSEASLSSVCRL
jgi:hypothetical protein